MKPRSLTPEWRISRSSRRSTVWANVAWEIANAMWWTQPGSVGVRSESGTRSSLVKIVISRPSPGSKYRWLSAALSRLGCSNTNGIPSVPSQKSIDVCRSAPTSVMWWTPWLWMIRMSAIYQLRLVLAPLERPPGHQVDPRLHYEHAADPLTNRVGEVRVLAPFPGELDDHRQRRFLPHARRRGRHADVAADVGREAGHDLADRRREDVDSAHDQHVVGAADAADARRGADARARAGLHDDVVARPEA